MAHGGKLTSLLSSWALPSSSAAWPGRNYEGSAQENGAVIFDSQGLLSDDNCEAIGPIFVGGLELSN